MKIRLLPTIYTIIFAASFISCENKSLNPKLEDLERRIGNIESKLSINSNETYVVVIAEKLNIRSEANSKAQVLAIAERGTYLRVYSYNFDSTWARIGFSVGGFPYLGWISSHKNYIKQEFLDANAYNNVSKSNLIKIEWEEPFIKKLVNNSINIVGVYFNFDDESLESNIKNYLVNLLLDKNISAKYISTFDESKVSDICFDNLVQGIIYIKLTKNNENTVDFNIQLFDMKNQILYSNIFPFNSTLFY